ncbi:MAG: hypothetical protein U1E46_12240 [Hyphomicrobiales bacterium]
MSVSGTDARQLIVRQFVAFDPSYTEDRKRYETLVRQAAQTLARVESLARDDVACSRQIYLEAKWYATYTADWPAVAQRLFAFRQSLGDPHQSYADEQQPDGTWGACFTVPFQKLEATVEGLEAMEAQNAPLDHPLPIPDVFRSTTNLRTYLESLVVSDIPKTGVDQRAQLNSVITSLGRPTFKKYWQPWLEAQARGTLWSTDGGSLEAVRRTLRQFVDDWQDPVTGFWGAWYRDGERIYRTADLSITFHIISYLGGNVPHKEAIARQLLAMKYEDYPFGWMIDGRSSNHNNYDVVKIARLLWDGMSADQRKTFSDEIDVMVDYALLATLNFDGRVQFDSDVFESTSAEYYYLVSLLEEADFWGVGTPYWMDGDDESAEFWKHASAVCKLIKQRLDLLHLKDRVADSTREKLDRHCPDKA